jgi:hypothetical protein
VEVLGCIINGLYTSFQLAASTHWLNRQFVLLELKFGAKENESLLEYLYFLGFMM